MTVTNDVLIGVVEAMEETGYRPTVAEGRKLAEALASRFPGLALGSQQSATRAHWTRWTDEEEQRVRELWSEDVPVEQIAIDLGRSVGAIKGACSRLGLHRSDRNRASVARRRQLEAARSLEGSQ